MLDWLIVGGGIHGTHLAFVLTVRAGVPHDRLCVLDPYPYALARWEQVTTNVGMTYLRSPIVHHLHDDQGALALYARIHERDMDMQRAFIPPYSRPSLALFNQHSRYLIARYGLDDMRIVGRAIGLSRLANGWRVETADGGLEARRVVLAIGLSEQPAWPDWAVDLREQGAPVNHIFDPAFMRPALRLSADASVVVVGGGITAAQTAMTLAGSGARVTLLMRHAPRVHDFDSDTGWMNAINLSDYAKIADPARRREVIRSARHRGSMPPDVARDLSAADETGRVRIIRAQVRDAAAHGSGICLMLENEREVSAEHLILATGYEPQRPGGAWLGAAIAQYGLPVAGCGYPLVDAGLCWAPGLYVSGPLAELEVGPPARNIIGARMAGGRLLAHA